MVAQTIIGRFAGLFTQLTLAYFLFPEALASSTWPTQWLHSPRPSDRAGSAKRKTTSNFRHRSNSFCLHSATPCPHPPFKLDANP